MGTMPLFWTPGVYRQETNRGRGNYSFISSPVENFLGETIVPSMKFRNVFVQVINVLVLVIKFPEIRYCHVPHYDSANTTHADTDMSRLPTISDTVYLVTELEAGWSLPCVAVLNNHPILVQAPH